MHTNPNMHVHVLHGIEQGEIASTSSDGDSMYDKQVVVATILAEELRPKGDLHFVVGGFVKARVLARAQGFIAAYRTAKEHA